MKRKSKFPDVLKRVRDCVDSGRYFDTTHAKLRKIQRNISLPHVLYVLKNGFHEKRKDEYKLEYNDWTYAIRAQTIDGKDLRIAIAFDDNDMLIITVVDVTRGTK